jgi:hypothetical protein
MTPERWQDVRRVLDSALELAPDERPAYLDRACASDQSLRREVQSLLDSGTTFAPASCRPLHGRAQRRLRVLKLMISEQP